MKESEIQVPNKNTYTCNICIYICTTEISELTWQEILSHLAFILNPKEAHMLHTYASTSKQYAQWMVI